MITSKGGGPTFFSTSKGGGTTSKGEGVNNVLHPNKNFPSNQSI